MSSPCASAGPARRYLCPHPACGPICRGTHGGWQRCGVHTSLITLLEEGIHIEAPERVCHLCPWISQLKDRHIQSCRYQLFPLPTPSAALHLCWWPAVSLTVEYPSESGDSPWSGEEGGESPPPTVVHWDFSGLLCGCTAPVWVVSLASVTSSTPEALLTCCGAPPTSWLKESDPLAATTGILWTGFSA